MKKLSVADRRRVFDAVMHVSVMLILGKRLEIQGKGGLVIYAGSSTVDRHDPYWYEGPFGRTYKETSEEIAKALLPHVGVDALLECKVF